MQGNFFVVSLAIEGALTADVTRRFSLPVGATLIGANAGCDNTTSFIFEIGTAADADAYLTATTVTGAAATTTDIAASDLIDGEPMHIPANTEIVITVDYDGGAGGDGTSPNIDLFFREG